LHLHLNSSNLATLVLELLVNSGQVGATWQLPRHYLRESQDLLLQLQYAAVTNQEAGAIVRNAAAMPEAVRLAGKLAQLGLAPK